MDVSWAIDFFTVPTLHFTTSYVFLILDHSRRKVIRFAVTRHPCLDWVLQQLRESMPFGLQPKYLFRDSHLERLLQEFINEYYHVARPHQGLKGDTPMPHTVPPEISGPSKLISIPVLGGLHHRYVRVAA